MKSLLGSVKHLEVLGCSCLFLQKCHWWEKHCLEACNVLLFYGVVWLGCLLVV